MKSIFKACLVAAIVTAGGQIDSSHVMAAPEVFSNSQTGVEVLTRGPVHEAFASTISYDPDPGVVIPRVAPELIEELPPDQRPAGDNVEWIPGYWSWDDERTDFIWISGLWRNLPPGREWVTGYWRKVNSGSQWTSGYWADATLNEREYLPEPPATAETGPNVAQPSQDHIWLPGCWIWQQNRYVWRPGFWTVGQPNWDWVPSQYVWSPRGYTYVNGYWDYPYDRRGVLFSPIYFQPDLYRSGGSYSPTVAMNLGSVVSNLFLRPSYGHYYFGDYYGDQYSTQGFYPWYSYNSNRNGYDPIFAHQRWRNRNDSNWSQRMEQQFQHRRDNDDARPSRIWNEQDERTNRNRPNDNRDRIADFYEEIVKNRNGESRFESLDPAARQRLSSQRKEIESSRQERLKLEAETANKANVESGNVTQPSRVKVKRSPVVSKPTKQRDQKLSIPERLQESQPDPKVEPQQRPMRGRSGNQGLKGTVKPGQTPSRDIPKVQSPRDLPKGQSPRDLPKVLPPGGSAPNPRFPAPEVKPSEKPGKPAGTSPSSQPDEPKGKPEKKS